jgi:Skp family chaperone for outer membrane proteins
MSHSRSHARLALLGAGALVLIGAAWRAGASSAPPPVAAAAPTAVAFVDFKRVYESLKETTDRAARTFAQREAFQKEVDTLSKQLKALQADVEAAKEGSPAWVEANFAYQEAEIGARARTEGFDRRLSLMLGNNSRELYLKFLGTLDFFAQREGWDAIVLDDRGISMPDLAPNDKVTEIIGNKKVLYLGAKADITDEIIEVMNNDYAMDINRAIPIPAPVPENK